MSLLDKTQNHVDLNKTKNFMPYNTPSVLINRSFINVPKLSPIQQNSFFISSYNSPTFMNAIDNQFKTQLDARLQFDLRNKANMSSK